jgi:hypothetical protein
VTSLLLIALALGACTSGRELGPGSPEPRLVRFNGILCVTHPCFNIDVTVVDGSGERQVVSDVDLRLVELTAEEREQVLARVHSEGITALGDIEVIPDAGPAGDGRTFKVTRLLDPPLGKR